MEEMIAYCGLVCTSCPTYLATQNDDDVARAKTAAHYNKKFGFDVTAQDINCDGCLSEGGKLIAYCQNCEIRECCQDKGLEHCAVCDDQPCEKLAAFHQFSPDAKASFDLLVNQKGAGK